MRGIALAAACLLLPVAAAAAQGDDTFVVFAGNDYSTPYGAVLSFDRSLALVNGATLHGGPLATQYGAFLGMATDTAGRRWVPTGEDSAQVLRLDPQGKVIDEITAPMSVRFLTAGPNGQVVGLAASPWGAFALDSRGTTIWSGPFQLGSFVFPPWSSGAKLCLTSSSKLWIGGVVECSFVVDDPVLVDVELQSGSNDGLEFFPGKTACSGGDIGQMAATIDGSFWAWMGGKLVCTDGEAVLQSLSHPNNFYGDYGLPYVRTDGQGRVLASVYTHWQGPDYYFCWGSSVRRHDPELPASPELITFDGVVRGFALGPTGEELFVVLTPGAFYFSSSPARLVRVNLVTGVRSSALLSVDWKYYAIPQGDPTGFIVANTGARHQDADGDGALNGDETAAGSNPFDPESRPDGPKVYVAFAPGTNAIEMTLFDPDGLRHATKGIDFGTMSVTVGGSGNVFWALLGFVTEASLSADGKTAHVVFGGLPLASDLKLRVEMSVRDRTGAIGWDWQATPPGDL